jgi:hypothetical protein
MKDILEDCLKQGFGASSPDARTESRISYFSYAKLFPEDAERMLNELEPSVQKYLFKESKSPNLTLKSKEINKPKSIIINSPKNSENEISILKSPKSNNNSKLTSPLKNTFFPGKTSYRNNFVNIISRSNIF